MENKVGWTNPLYFEVIECAVLATVFTGTAQKIFCLGYFKIKKPRHL